MAAIIPETRPRDRLSLGDGIKAEAFRKAMGLDSAPMRGKGLVAMSAVDPIALSPAAAAAFLGISKRSLSRLIADEKVIARKDGSRTLVDVASLKSYYENLPIKDDHAPLPCSPQMQ